MTIYCTLSTYMYIHENEQRYATCICIHHKEELDTTSSTASLVLQNIRLSTFQFSDKGLGMLTYTCIFPVDDDRNYNVACHLYSARLVRPPA